MSLGSFLLIVLIGHTYGARGVGVFALAQSILIALSVFARSGMDGALVRFIGRDPNATNASAYLSYAVRRSLLLASIGTVVLFLSRAIFSHLFHSPDFTVFFGIFILAAPPFVIAFVLSGFMAAIGSPASACTLQNGAIAIVTSMLLFALISTKNDLGIMNIAIAYVLGAWLVTLVGSVAALRRLRSRINNRQTSLTHGEIHEFKRSSSAFFATDIAAFLITSIGLWVAGYWLSTTDVGQYQVASQVTMVIGLIMTVMNLVVPREFAALHHLGRLNELERLARRTALAALILGALPLLACLFTPQLVLGIFGHDFTGAEIALRILAIAQILGLGCGSIAHLLNMTGHETLSRNITWIGNVIGIVIIASTTPFLGIAGVALGVGVALGFRKVAGVYVAWHTLHIWAVPIPRPRTVAAAST